MHRATSIICVLALAGCGASDTSEANPGTPIDSTPATNAAAAPAGEFVYGGMTVPDSFASILARYPLSKPRGPIDYIRLVPTEEHDGIKAIGFIQGEAGSRVSFRFEKDPGLVTAEPPSTRNPKCETVQSKLIASYGQPDSVRLFAYEAQARRDRYWTRGREIMVLLCFVHADTLYADALTIERHVDK